MSWEVIEGDCVQVMAGMPDASIDACVCDPPYGLEFMGKEWDRIAAKPRGRTAGMAVDAPTIEVRDDSPQHRAAVRQPSHLLRCARCGGNSSGEWNRCTCAAPDFRSCSDLGHAMQEWHERWAREALRVLKPGGFLLAFGGSRTYHRLACAVEDAGFEIRDMIDTDSGPVFCDGGFLSWRQGSGFPKSRHVGCRCADGDRDVPGLPPRIPSVAGTAASSGGAEVLPTVQRSATRSGVGDARAQGLGGSAAPTGHAGSAQSGVEGRCDAEATEGQPSGRAVRARADVGAADGAEGRLCDAAPTHHGADRRAVADADGGRPSPESRAAGQPAGEPGVVADERGSQARGGREVCARCGEPVGVSLGSALKPAHEPIVVARKPLSGTLAATVTAHGTGAMNIDGCRIGTDAPTARPPLSTNKHEGYQRPWNDDPVVRAEVEARREAAHDKRDSIGRWPANTILVHSGSCRRVGTRRVKGQNPVMRNDQTAHGGYHGISPRKAGTALGHADADGMEEVEAWECADGCPVKALDEQSGELVSGANPARRGADGARVAFGEFGGQSDANPQRGRDSGTASRFYYTAKSSAAERNAGLDGFEERDRVDLGGGRRRCATCSAWEWRPQQPDLRRCECGDAAAWENVTTKAAHRNVHPTVKPVAVMRWLVRLVTPPGGVVLDPFTGSGSTGIACVLEGFRFIGIEREPDYVAIARARVGWWAEHGEDGLRITGEREARERRADAAREARADAGQLGLFGDGS